MFEEYGHAQTMGIKDILRDQHNTQPEMNENIGLQFYNGLREDGGNDNQPSDDNYNSDNLDQDELEIALYSQIHFETSDTVEAPEGLQNTTEAPEGLNDDYVAEKFMIDVQGNDKIGFQTGLTTADYVTNEIIGVEYGTSLHLANGIEEKTSENQRLPLFTKAADSDKNIAEKQVKERNKNKISAKLNKNRNLAEKLILKVGSSSDSADLDSDLSVDSANTESDSDDDLIDLDLEDSEDDSGLFVNVSRNQRPLLETNNVNDWSIDENDVPDYTSRFNKSRYYKPINFSCHNCDKIGHLSKNCPQPKKAQTCAFCSETGHHMKICPDAFCYNCEEPGHIAKECGQPKKKWFTQCTRCSMQGHRKSKCPDQWRQYHKTVDGKKLIREKKKPRERNSFCYNCAGDDHLGHECEEDRMDRYSQPSNPFICNYVPINYNYSQFERDFPSNREAEQGRKHSSKKTDKKTINFPHSFVKKGSLRNTTGRNNFDKLLFASRENRNKTSTPSSSKRKKQPSSTHIIFDDSLFSASKLESDFKFGFKSPVRFDFDSLVSDKKRKIDSEVVSPSKKQKVSDSSKKVQGSAKKGIRKRNIENYNTESPRRSKMNEEDSLGVISVTLTNKDDSKFENNFAKKRNISVTRSRSKSNRKQEDNDMVYPRMKDHSKNISDTFKDEINVMVSNEETDFPRGGKKKKDSFRDVISVSFTNNLAKSGNERKSERGFIKTKKFESVVINSDESCEEIDHQVYNNEWWLKKNGKKNKRKNKKKPSL